MEHKNRTLVDAARTMLFFRVLHYSYGLKQLLLHATLKTAPSFTVDSKKHHMSLLTAENQISPFFMYSGLSVIPRMIVKTMRNLVQKDVDELEQQQHVQKQDNQAPLQPKIVADNVLNAMLDANIFVNPFAPPSTSAAELSSSQYVDPLNMHTFYQPYPHEYLWNKDHHQEQVIGEPSRPVLIRNQLRTDCDMCIYALTVSTMELRNIKGAMTSPAWIDSMQEELLLFKRLDPDEENTVIQNKTYLVVRGYRQEEGIDFEESSCLQVKEGSLWVKESTKGMIKDKLDLDKNGTLVDATKYRSMIGALMYLTSSTPYIVHATCLCARYQAKPTEKHLKEVKRIFRYLWGTVNMDTFKSTSGGTQFLGEKLVSWLSKKQDCTALLTTEAEYVSLSA
ncbi:hypothetical protein Tco_1155317 [Tanacetum coccineum]